MRREGTTYPFDSFTPYRAYSLLELLVSISILLLLFALLAPVLAATRSRAERACEPHLTASSFHFDDRWCGESIDGHIHLKNDSGRDVTLTRVKTYCGFIERVEAGVLPRTILAGQTASLACLLKLPEVEQVIDQKVELYLHESEHPAVARVTGRTVAPFPVSIDLGTFAPPHEHLVNMRRLKDRATPRLRAVRCLDGSLQTRRVSDTQLALEAPGSLPLGSRVDTLLDVEFADASFPAQRIRVTGRASNGLIVDADPVVFGRIAIHDPPPTREVVIEDVQRRPLRLIPPGGLPDVLTLEMEQVSPSKVRCRVTANVRTPLKLEESIRLTDASGDRAVILTCVGVAE